MSIQDQTVFRHCLELASELATQHREEESVSVLRALHTYLDSTPAFPDRSCRSIVESRIQKVYAVVRERELKKVH
jgi:hypothetical protein